jgi:hypothetical protein
MVGQLKLQMLIIYTNIGTTFFGQDMPSLGNTEDQEILRRNTNVAFHILHPVHYNSVMTIRNNECIQFY